MKQYLLLPAGLGGVSDFRAKFEDLDLRIEIEYIEDESAMIGVIHFDWCLDIAILDKQQHPYRLLSRENIIYEDTYFEKYKERFSRYHFMMSDNGRIFDVTASSCRFESMRRQTV